MPLYIPIPNTSPYAVVDGMAAAVIAGTADGQKPAVSGAFCPCLYQCTPGEIAFANQADTADWRTNDRSQWLYAKTRASDTIAFELIKSGAKVADVDASLGSTWNGFSGQPLYVGLEIEWLKVAQAHGLGKYQIRSKFKILGREWQTDSRVFHVEQFSELRADKTVRVESYQNGNILGSPFDFTGLVDGGWRQWVRIRGRFGDRRPVLKQDSYMDSSYRVRQIQDRILSEYTLSSQYLPHEVASELFYRSMLADSILVTDYSLMAHERLDRVDVVPTEVSDAENNRALVRQSWKFRDRVQDNIKTMY